MMANPKVGQRVRVGYARRPAPGADLSRAEFMPLQGREGVVRIRGRPTRGAPRNHGVEIDGVIFGIPCGNLFKVD